MMNLHLRHPIPAPNSVQLQDVVYTYIKCLQHSGCLEAPTTTMEERYHYSSSGVQVVSESALCEAGPVWVMLQMRWQPPEDVRHRSMR